MRAALLALIAMLSPLPALAQACPQPLASATRLVLVTTDGFNSPFAAVQRFERPAPNATWQVSGGAASGHVGRLGVGWAHAFRAYGRRGEPSKVEGDKRAPAGFFKIGRPFGFAASDRPGYMRITEGMTCVSDLGSNAYNSITTRDQIGSQVRGENMRHVPEYARGLLIDYPTDRKARAGSCIFFHLQLPGKTGTGGCIAMPEPQLEAVQDHVQGGAVVAILPRLALERFKGCLPN